MSNYVCAKCYKDKGKWCHCEENYGSRMASIPNLDKYESVTDKSYQGSRLDVDCLTHNIWRENFWDKGE
ncbi:MAG: hypothetical protein CMD96_05890 [Gammaproteobacteria bacterium]|mgnify:CR=1 FL=1|nr:hypothetical protein [Gammaproteobacteria bacterium]|tara:strand:+ start:701 stop:907 length:207 start_codon:yes stop_codon:yes gene_type:complete